MKKLLLIDGNSIMNRGFYALPVDLTNQEGLHTNALLGFLNIFFRIYEEEHPTNICVAFDVHAPTFRHEQYSEYKGKRSPMPDELREQMPVIKEVLKAMQIPVVELAGYEADDLIGTLSKQGEEAGMDVTVLSGDRDLLQLATDRVMIRIPKTRGGKTTVEDYKAAEVESTYGVTPVEFIEMKGLMGDTSDNIPGVPGIGPKTAEKLIRSYHTVESVIEHIPEMPQNKMRAALEENKEMAVFSRDLSRILLDAPVPVELSETEVGKEEILSDTVRESFTKLGLKSLMKHFADVQPKVREFHPEIREGRFSEIKAFAEKGDVVGFYPVFSDDMLLGTAFSLKDMVFLTATDSVPAVVELLNWFLTNKITISVPGIKELIRPFRITPEEDWFDVSVAAYLLDPLTGEYPYHTLLEKYLGLEVKSEKDLVGKQELSVFSFATEEFREVFAMKAYMAQALCPVLKQKLEEQDMYDLYCTMEHPATFVLQDMEAYGIRVDRPALEAYGKNLDQRIEALTKEIYEEAGEDFNINSPKQLGVILFEKLGLTSGKKTKSGYSTNVDVLVKIRDEHPIVPAILEYRQLTKLRSTYVEGLMTAIADDGRIHSRFHQTVTATGRISSSDPNLQNIPMRTQLGRELRKIFIPADGFVFVDADYSQIELRVMAAMSDDENLIEAFRQSQDIHASTASKVFHVPLEEVDSNLRRKAKAVNFGIIYGISSFGLGQDLDISRKEAQDYINQYFETYQGVKKFLDLLVETGKKTGVVRTLYNRIRPIPELKSSNFMTRQFGERVAMNSPIQGTAADIIKIAMIRVREELLKRGMKSRLILQIHDELLIEAAKDEVEEVKELLERNMREAAELSVPLYVDMHTGENLYDTK
ncbi:MAG: DNA polymerase I [Eubacterium sp.]|nr:DNA polymerase I [Eubacterium sp.]